MAIIHFGKILCRDNCAVLAFLFRMLMFGKQAAAFMRETLLF